MGARYTPESEPVAAFGDESFPTVTQPDDASTRYAAMIKFFNVTVSALFPVDTHALRPVSVALAVWQKQR